MAERSKVQVTVSSDPSVRIPLLLAVFVFSVSFSSENIAEIRFSTYWDQQSDAEEQIKQQKQKLTKNVFTRQDGRAV